MLSAARQPRFKTTVNLDRAMLDWLTHQIGTAKRFHNLSHALDTAILSLQDKDAALHREATLTAALKECEARLQEARRGRT